MLICSAPDAQLAVAIATPAPEGAAGRYSARVLVSCSDNRDVACRLKKSGLLSINHGFQDRQTYENHTSLCVHEALRSVHVQTYKPCKSCSGTGRRRLAAEHMQNCMPPPASRRRLAAGWHTSRRRTAGRIGDSVLTHRCSQIADWTTLLYSRCRAGHGCCFPSTRACRLPRRKYDSLQRQSRSL